MAGRERIGPEIARGFQKVGELDRLVARNAWNRRLAGRIACGERVDHRLAEPVLVVEDVMGNAERLGDAPGIVDVLAGTAGTRPVDGGSVVVELQRHAEDVVALALHQARHDGRIDATGHGDDHPGLPGPLVDIETVHRRSRHSRAFKAPIKRLRRHEHRAGLHRL